MKDSTTIQIQVRLDNGDETQFSIYARFPRENSMELIDESIALENGEACIQLREGCSYEYKIEQPYRLAAISKVVSVNKSNPNTGLITPNIYVGSLLLEILDASGLKKGSFSIEVCSIKAKYRTDYRRMLEDITDRCIDLLMQHTSPVTQNFETDTDNDTQSIYQRFAFVKSMVESAEFTEAFYRVQDSPVTNWTNQEEQLDTRKVRKMNNAVIKQFARSQNRVSLGEDHYLRNRFSSIPAKINCHTKQTTTDTPENQFVKYVLNEFLHFCSDIREKFNQKSRAYKEAIQLENVLENMLGHAMFKGISNPTVLALNSPVLQRKSGYREILRVWLMFDLAAKLVWKGGDDVYDAGKRDVAVLYEYWVFFMLLDIFCELFVLDTPPVEQLIAVTKDGLELQLKKGRKLALTGKYNATGRKLNITFSFNRTFSSGKEYPRSGSWTRGLRPDYTISIWPDGITAAVAEEKELISHIHFDAKYKVDNLDQLLEESDEQEEELEKKTGVYRRTDLIKMHAYKDAIRRTAGAFILYPGGKPFRMSQYHEVLPGIGAFPLCPSVLNKGIGPLKAFIQEIIDHILNPASQREELAYRVYHIHRNKNRILIKDAIPEFNDISRNIPPNDIKVIVGYFKDDYHYKWIEKHGLYNIRFDIDNEPISLEPEIINAGFLLLHGKGELIARDIRRITRTGPQVFSKEGLKKLKYPNPRHNHYLVYSIERKSECNNSCHSTWDIRKINGFRSGRLSGVPFVVSLTELMEATVKL